MNSFSVTYRDIFSILKNNSHLRLEVQKELVLNNIILMFELDDCEKVRAIIQNKLKTSFYNNIERRLQKLSKNKRNYEFFECYYSNCLQGELCISFETIESNKDFTPSSNKFFPLYRMSHFKTTR